MNEFSLKKTYAIEVMRKTDKFFWGKTEPNSISKTLFHQEKLPKKFWAKQKLQTNTIERNKKRLYIEIFLNISKANPAVL